MAVVGAIVADVTLIQCSPARTRAKSLMHSRFKKNERQLRMLGIRSLAHDNSIRAHVAPFRLLGARYRNPPKQALMKTINLTAAVILLASPAWALDNTAVKVEPLMTTVVTSSDQPIVLPPHAKVIVSMYIIQPGAKLPEHKHLHARYGYMESGILRVSANLLKSFAGSAQSPQKRDAKWQTASNRAACFGELFA